MMTLNNLWNSYNLPVYYWPWTFSRISQNLRRHSYPLENNTKQYENITNLCASTKKLNILNIKVGIHINWECWLKKPVG